MGNAHSKIGASSCARWWECPGSVKLSEGIPDSTSVYAAEGTVAHTVAEEMLVGKKVQHEAGDKVEHDEFMITVTEEMIEHVVSYCGVVMGDLRDAGLGIDRLEVEARLQLTHIDKDAFGTADAVIYEPLKKLTVYDLKYGRGVPVEVVENKQALYYLSGAARGKSFEMAEVVIVQPRCPHPDGPVRRWEVSPERLAEFEKDLAVKVSETRKGNAKLKSGKWCKFCRASYTCPEIRNEMDNLPALKGMTPDTLAKTLEKAIMVEGWITAIRKHAKEAAENGAEIPGYELTQGYGRRKWNMTDKEVIQRIMDTVPYMTGDELDKLYEPLKIKSPAKMEKVIKKEQLSDLWIKPKTSVVLSPISDSRKVKSDTALSFFKPIPKKETTKQSDRVERVERVNH